MNTYLKHSLFVVAIALGGILFHSCDSKTRTSEVDVTKENDITWKTIGADTIYYLDNDEKKPSCSLDLSYTYPDTYANEEVLQSPVDKGIALYVSDYVKNYKDEAERYKEGMDKKAPKWEAHEHSEDYYSFSKKIKSELLFNKANIISYQVKSHDDKGGANSFTMYRNIVLDLNTGKPLSEYDIFVAEYKYTLNKILTEKIIAQNNVKTIDDLLELGYWCIEDLDSNNNFFVDDKGITYIYNEGECSAPSVGTIIIPIGFDELKEILRDDSVIASLF